MGPQSLGKGRISAILTDPSLKNFVLNISTMSRHSHGHSNGSFKRRPVSWRKNNAKTKVEGKKRFYNRGFAYVMGLRPRGSRGSGQIGQKTHMFRSQAISEHRPPISDYSEDAIDSAMQDYCDGQDCPKTRAQGYCALALYCSGTGYISVAKSSSYKNNDFIGLLEVSGHLS